MIAGCTFRNIKPLKRRVVDVLERLSKDGFRLVYGSDSGWFGDGMYILTNSRESLRITRSRKEEFLDIAFNSSPSERDWFGVAELMVAIGDISFEDAVGGHAMPHDLDFKLENYLRVRSEVDAQLGPKPGANERLLNVRRKSREFAQQAYGGGT
jgi:hypothetical protein